MQSIFLEKAKSKITTVFNYMLLASVKNRLFKGFNFEFFRLLKYTLLSKLGALQLHSIFISLTHRCNANCIHCYEKFQTKDKIQEITTSEVKKIIDQFYALGGYKIHFCSGEVLLRNDLMELIKYARSKHILVSITTNGLLIDKEKLKELAAVGLNELIFSIDSTDPQVHNTNRGVDHCLENAIKAIKLTKNTKIGPSIWTYVTKKHNDLENILNLGKRLQLKMIFVYFPLLSGHYFNKPEINLNYTEREEIRKKFNNKQPLLLEFQNEYNQCNGGGHMHINVMPSGEVTFCPPVPYSYGNIKNRSLRDCLIDMKKDYKKFCTSKCTGQCPVNFLEYRENCNAKYLYPDENNSDDK